MGRRKPKSRHRKPKNEKEIQTVVDSSSAPPQPPWIELPVDITANILQRLGAEEILERAQKVCTTWRKVCQDPAMWRVIELVNLEHFEAEYCKMCLNAVDRSQGQLVDLSIIRFGHDGLINYVADRSSHLRRLHLWSCYDISGEGLVEAAKKLPQLEELHIIISPYIEAAGVEAIGIACPMLKSFTVNEHGSKYQLPQSSEDDEFMTASEYNEHALAIAKTMPNLRHLRLFAHWMKNEGLEAILDGCTHLESLDLRQCYKLDLGGDLGKRCRKQIKDLRLPSDSISDIEWLACEPPFDEWGGSSLYDSGCSDLYSFDDFDGYYEDFEQYDDFTSPLGIGFFGHDFFFDDD